MLNLTNNRFLAFIAFMIYALALSNCKNDKDELPYFSTADFTPEWYSDSELKSTQLHKIADFSFTDQNNEKVTNKDFEGKVYVSNFFFTTCPGICPQMTANMVKLQDYFKDDDRVKLISHTVTPWIDTVAQLQRYADEYNVIPDKWHLVTGEKENIYNIARNSYFAEMEIGTQLTADDFLHTENFILIDQHRHIRGIYNGTIENELNRIQYDIRSLTD